MLRTPGRARFACSFVWAALVASCDAPQDELSVEDSRNASLVVAIEDTYASEDAADQTAGELSRMWTDASPASKSFIKFPLGEFEGTAARATLRLWVKNPSGDGPRVYPCDPAWSQDTLTWNQRPARLGPALDDAGSLTSGSWLELDVTAAVSGGKAIAFELASSSKDGASFSTVESSRPPELLVEWSEAPEGPRAELIADSRAREDNPDTSYGFDHRLDADGNPRARSYLIFDVTGADAGLEGATLRLWVRDPSGDGPAVYPTEADWSEASLTWNQRPQRIGGILDDAGAVSGSTWVEYDVSSWITQNGRYGLELFADSGDGTVFSSRETSNPPELLVEPASSSPDPEPDPDPDPPAVASTTVTLVPQSGVSGSRRVNFAVPLPPGTLSDAALVSVHSGGEEIAAARRGLATYTDGSLRSVQLQVDLDVTGGAALEVRVGESPGTPGLAIEPVADTLLSSGEEPAVWALLEPTWLAASGVAGPQRAAQASVTDDAWEALCDYDRYDTAAFLQGSDSRGYWLYDRVTTSYKGYVRHGDVVPLRSAYREAHLYLSGISGTGTETRIGVPDAAGDAKYHYTQGLAIHYLLTGDDRFRERAEDVAVRLMSLWPSPGYNGGSDFWTERHAGFALLGYVWAAMVSDDRSAEFIAEADDAVDAYLAIQDTYPTTWSDPDRRCFAHSATSHAESYGTWGCSPWMSAILAEGLDIYASERGGSAAVRARDGIVKLGRMLATHGLDGSGKPYYWLAVGGASEIDPYDEHWGESAYIVAMAWHHAGRTETALRQAALALIDGLDSHGSAPHLRSFNWQCRGAVATPFYLE